MSAPVSMLVSLFHGADVEAIFSAENQLAGMVRFEVALAYAVEVAGLAPVGTGEACAGGVAGFPAQEHVDAIAEGAVLSGNVAIPFVKLLTEFVRVRAGDAANFIHFGATSQDVLDTSLVLQLRQFCGLATAQIEGICGKLVTLVEVHRNTLLAGRTWMQQGPPVTFGLKAAQWLSAMLRHLERLSAVRDRACVLQFGGAVGTLASLGEQGAAVTRELAYRLELAVPDTPWHSQRDSLAEMATVAALIDGTLGKIARDLSLMVQNEVAEVHFAAAGGSSTMPHKRNPVQLAVVLASATRAPGLASTMLSAMVQEHERGLGGWHAEWETLPELCRLTCGALAAMSDAIGSLRIDGQGMRRNLDLLHGVSMAEAVSMQLSGAVGRPEAHRILEAASRTALERGIDLLVVLRADPLVTAHLSLRDLEQALEPSSYLGSTDLFIDQVLKRAAECLRGAGADAVS